jgi:hypothetical protein
MKNSPLRTRHLSSEELFGLTFPAIAGPEALPPHLSGCGDCSRALAEWRAAAADLAEVPEGPSADFARDVMARVHRLPIPRSRRWIRRGAAASAAAAALLAAFWLGTRVPDESPAAPEARAASAMTASDRADDALLREVSRLVDSDAGGAWTTIAPVPGGGQS